MAVGVQVPSTDGTGDSTIGPALPAAGGPSALSFTPQIDFSQNFSVPPSQSSVKPKPPEQPRKGPSGSIAQSAVMNFAVHESDTGSMAADNHAVPVNQNDSAGAMELSGIDARRLVPNPYVVVPEMELPGVASASGPAFRVHPTDVPRPSAEIATVMPIPIPAELRFENVIRSNAGGAMELASRYGQQDSGRIADYLIASATGQTDSSAVSQAVTFAEESGQAIVVSDPEIPLDNLQLTQVIAATTSARVQAWQSLFHSTWDGAPAGPRGKMHTLHRPGVLMSGVNEGSVRDAVHATLISSLMPDFFGHLAAPLPRKHGSLADYLISTLTDAWEEAPEFNGTGTMDPAMAALALALPVAQQNNEAIVIDSTQPPLQSGLCLVPSVPIELAIDRLPASESVEWFIQMSDEPMPNEAQQLQIVSADTATSALSSADGQPMFADSGSNPLPVDSQSFLGGGGGGGGVGQGAAFAPVATGYLPPQQFAVNAPVSFAQYYAVRSSSHRTTSLAGASLLSTAMLDPASSAGSLGIAVPLLVRANLTASPGAALPPGVIGYKVVDLNPGGLITSSQAVAVLGTESAGFIQHGTSFAHAAVWASTASASFTDINPSASYSNSNVNGFSGSQFVGSAFLTSAIADHAILWTHTSGTTYAATDLNPSGYTSSFALVTNGSRQFGYGYTNSSGGSQALLWNSVATSFVNLNPTGFNASEILGANSTLEVGYGQFNNTNGGQLNAMLWTGTSKAATNLQPTDISMQDSRGVSISSGTSGSTLIGGYGTAPSGFTHGLLWTSLSASSAVDLNPAGYMDSQVTAVSSFAEVGFGRVNGDFDTEHALLWTGSATNVTDLNTYLPSNFTWAEAEGIDASGNVVGWALNSTSGNFEAVEWLAQVPEPSSLAVMAVAAGFLATRRRRRNRPTAEQSEAV